MSIQLKYLSRLEKKSTISNQILLLAIVIAVTGTLFLGKSFAAGPATPYALTSTIADGSTISGTVDWSVSLSPQPQSVEFYIDGVKDANVELTAPYNYKGTLNSLDTTKLTNGNHTFQELAIYANSTWSAKHTVTVNNTAPTPPPSPVPPPSSGTYPASYYAGPLGAKNILPTKPGAFLIDYPGGPGTTWATMTARNQQLEQAMGRKFDAIHINYWGGGTYQGISNCILADTVNERREQWVHDHGAFPVVSWSPDKSIAEVNSGAVDQCFINAAKYFKTYNFPVMLRLWWEFDNTAGFPWAVGQTANTGQPYITAWRRVVNIFQQQGASNVGFWWTPLEGSPDRAGITASYPGDAYVDWVGSDAYNGCYVGENNCWSGYAYEGWASLQKIAAYGPNPDINQYDQWSARKPFVFGEVGTTLDPANPSYKAQWFRDIAPLLKNRMPKATGISFFDQDVSSLEGARNNWLIDYPTSNPDVFAGFKQMANDPWFNTQQ